MQIIWLKIQNFLVILSFHVFTSNSQENQLVFLVYSFFKYIKYAFMIISVRYHEHGLSDYSIV